MLTIFFVEIAYLAATERAEPARFCVYGAVIPAQGIEPRLIGPLALAEHHRPFLGLKWTYQSTCGKWQFLGL